MQEKLLLTSYYVVADAYFAENKFATSLQEMRFGLISRLRDDASLFYPTNSLPTGEKGASKKYNGKIDFTLRIPLGLKSLIYTQVKAMFIQ